MICKLILFKKKIYLNYVLVKILFLNFAKRETIPLFWIFTSNLLIYKKKLIRIVDSAQHADILGSTIGDPFGQIIFGNILFLLHDICKSCQTVYIVSIILSFTFVRLFYFIWNSSLSSLELSLSYLTGSLL